jgi:tight adherence protein C
MGLILVLGLILLGAAAFVVARGMFEAADERAASVELARSYAVAGRVEQRRLSIQPLLDVLRRLLVRGALRFAWRTSREDLEIRLAAAGLTRRISLESYLALRFLCILTGVLFGFLLGGVSPAGFLLAVIFACFGVIVPRFVVARRANARADRISNDLPNFIDRLAVAMEAGLSFDAGVMHVVEGMKGALADELRIMLAEVRVGAARRRALRDLSQRVQAQEMATFISAILQAEQLGMSVANILRTQANEIRHRRQVAAEERAMKAPVKMLFPIVIFILPVMFVVILGPPLIDAVNSL